jgi:hypothetical protein
MNHIAKLRLTEAHERLKAILDTLLKSHGSWNNLENEMRNAGCPVDRRKLKSVWFGRRADVKLSLVELDNLDRYLHLQRLPGLKMVFQPKSLSAAIARTGTVRVWLGFKQTWGTADQDGQTTASHWDVRSMNFLFGELYRESDANFGILTNEVPLNENDGSSETWLAQLQQSSWCHDLHDHSQRDSLITVGSPKACHATEWVLAKMFGVPGFARNAAVDKLPFRFEYSPRLLESHPSAFACEAEELPATAPPRSRRFDIYALVFNNTRHALDFNEQCWMEYGVIATQRRAGGQIWTVIAGMSGPTTYVAAKKVVAVNYEFGGTTDAEGNSPVYCRAVQALVKRHSEPTRPGDNRSVQELDFLGDPVIWPEAQPAVPRPPKRRRKRTPK